MHLSSEARGLEEEIHWFLDYLLVERSASKHTAAAYERDLKQAAEFLSRRGIASFAQVDGDVAARLKATLRNYKQSTINRKLSAFRSLLQFLAKRSGKTVEHLPATAAGKRERPLPKALSPEEMERLAASPDVTTPNGTRDRFIIEMLYGGGLRVSELIDLRTEDYSADESLLRVFGKRGKVRVLPIPAETHDCLRAYLEKARPQFQKQACSNLLLNPSGRPFSRSGIFRILRKHAKNAGIEQKIGPHTLRHTYAVHLLRNGADLRSVQELLGHASLATTDVYTHLDIDTVRDKYNSAHPRAKRRAS